MLNIKSKAFKFLIGTLAVVAFSYASAAMDFGTTTLRVGSKGEAVKAVQTCVGATADGSFGPMTKAKVMAWQASNGLTADGVFGNMSKAKAATACGTTTTTTTETLCPNGMTLASNCMTAPGSTTTTTGGAAGLLTSVTKLSSYNSTKVIEGAKDVPVLGIQATAKDAAQTVDTLRVAFKNTNGSSNVRLFKYASEISVWLDGKEIGRKPVSSFSDDAGDTYTYRFTGMTGVIPAGMKSTILVAVTGASSMDSTDATNETWFIGAGTVHTGDADYLTAVSPNGRYDDYGASSVSSSIDFQKAGGATSDQKYKVSVAATSPVASDVPVSNTSDTSAVTLLAFDVKAENGGMLVQRIPVDFVSTIGPADGVTPNVEAIVKTAYLYANGVQLASESMTSGAGTQTITFGNTTKLGYAIASNATVKFEVKADLNDVENTGVASTDFDNGDAVKASYTSTNVTNSTVELDNVNRDTVSNRSGSATGENQTLRSTGLKVTMGAVTPSFTQNQSGQIASRVYSIALSVKAFDDSMYVSQTANNGASATSTNAFSYSLKSAAGALAAAQCTGANAPYQWCTGAGAGTPPTTSATLSSSDATIVGSAYSIPASSTKNFTLTVTVSGTAGAVQSQYKVSVNDVNPYTDSGLTTAAGIQGLSPVNSFETSYYPTNL